MGGAHGLRPNGVPQNGNRSGVRHALQRQNGRLGGASRSPISTHKGQWSRCRADLPASPLSAPLSASDRAIQRIPSEVQTCTHCTLPACASAREMVGASADNAMTQAVSQTSQRGKPRGRPERRFMSVVVKSLRALASDQWREVARENPFGFIL